jgi:hypothetical protein
MRSLRISAVVTAAVAAATVFWAFPTHAPADSSSSVGVSPAYSPPTPPVHRAARPVSKTKPAAKAAPRPATHVDTAAVVRPVTAPPVTTPPVTAPPVTTPPVTAPPVTAPAVPYADTCGAALTYLAAHSAPGFRFECPGYALGHQAMTCMNEPGVCPGQKLIAIAVVCPASYMNEASNSWVVTGRSDAPIDPYGYCP